MICPECKHITRISQQKNIKNGTRRYRKCIFCSLEFATFQNDKIPETLDCYRINGLHRNMIEYKLMRAKYKMLKKVVDSLIDDNLGIANVLERARIKSGISKYGR